MPGEPINPVEVETAIRDIANEIALGVRLVSDRLAAFRAAERTYDLEFARAYMSFSGPAHMRKYAAEIETTALREARDVAEAAWRLADRRARAQETELSAYQSINRSVSQMYGAAGVMGRG